MDPKQRKEIRKRRLWLALSLYGVCGGLAMLLFGGIFLESSISALVTGDVIDPANARTGLAFGIVIAVIGIVSLLLGIKGVWKYRHMPD